MNKRTETSVFKSCYLHYYYVSPEDNSLHSRTKLCTKERKRHCLRVVVSIVSSLHNQTKLLDIFARVPKVKDKLDYKHAI